MRRSNHLLREIVIICGLILAIGAPRWFALNRFVTTDESVWLKYSGLFYYALTHHDFASTFQVGHPGVTVMWAGLTGYMQAYPAYKDNYSEHNRPIGLANLEKRDANLPLQILVAGRQTMFLLHILILSLSFLFARRLVGTVSALAGFLLIAFDPFHIALSRILQPDGLLADLMLLSLLALLVYVSDHKVKTLMVSAVAAGLAWLTKSPGLFLIPLIGPLMLFDELRSRSNRSKTEWRKSIFQIAKVTTLWGMVGILVFYLLWPSMWIDPVGSLVKMLKEAIGYAETGHDSSVFFNGNIYANGDIPDIRFYPISFLWRTTPVVLLGLFATAMLFFQGMLVFLGSGKSPNSLSENQTSESKLLQGTRSQLWNMAVLVFFSVGFGALMSMGLKKFDRYIIPSIVVMDLVAGVGLVWLVGSVGKLLHGKWRSFLPVGLLLSFMFIQAVLAWTPSPYFFSYYNPLLGGTQRAVEVMQIGWGEGLDQAARYINSQPNSDQLQVLAWYGIGPFSYISKSKVLPLDIDHQWTSDNWNQFSKSDYIVIYIHEWQRNLPSEVLDRLRNLKPEYSVWINGLEYVRIYKIR